MGSLAQTALVALLFTGSMSGSSEPTKPPGPHALDDAPRATSVSAGAPRTRWWGPVMATDASAAAGAAALPAQWEERPTAAGDCGASVPRTVLAAPACGAEGVWWDGGGV